MRNKTEIRDREEKNVKPPLETIKGRIVGYDTNRQELLIRAPYADHFTMCKREFKDCLVQPIDSRSLSDKQRRACYALIGAVSDYSGDSKDSTKEFLKLRFLASEIETLGEDIFSLSNAPMSLVCEFQRFIVRFIIENDIPCDFPLLEFVDDIADYVYSCLVNKKCCVCGIHADLHHVDRVGMGRDRTEILHEGMRALPLCREHHMEAHNMGEDAFQEKYHLSDGIELDKTLCRIYKLGRTKK